MLYPVVLGCNRGLLVLYQESTELSESMELSELTKKKTQETQPFD